MSDAEMLFDCIDKVRTFFKNEPDKAIFWFETENLNFGGFSPMALIRLGRVQKLHQIINDMLEGRFS